MFRDQMTCLRASAPTRSVRGDLRAVLWFYTGYVRLCCEKGTMRSCWKYAVFCGYFSFLSSLSWLFWNPSLLVESLCIPGEIMWATSPFIVRLNNYRGVLSSLLWHAGLPASSRNCTECTELLEGIRFIWMKTNSASDTLKAYGSILLEEKKNHDGHNHITSPSLREIINHIFFFMETHSTFCLLRRACAQVQVHSLRSM